MTEIIEGEAVDVTPGKAMTVLKPDGELEVVPGDRRLGAVFQLGVMSEAEFEAHVGTIKSGLERIRKLHRSLLVKGTDYDKIGTQRDVLLKPGAEKLASFASLVPSFTHTREETPAEVDRPPRITYTVVTALHYQTADGPVVGGGVGVCTTGEVKYLYRSPTTDCPTCGKPLRLSKDRPEWYCWAKQGGCGAKFPKDAIAAATGRVYNTDPYELENTVAKMAEKRSFTDAVIRTLNASSLFTQDVGSDYGEYGDSDPLEPSRGGSQPGDGDPRQSGGPQASSAEGARPDDGNGKWQGIVDEMPDLPGKGPGAQSNEVHLSVKVKAGRSTQTHHLYLTDYYAGWAQQQAPTLPKQQIVYVGHLTELPWGDGSKPPVKEVRAITSLAVRVTKDDPWRVIAPPVDGGDALQGGIDARMEEATPAPAAEVKPEDGWDDDLPDVIEGKPLVDPMTLPIVQFPPTTMFDQTVTIIGRSDGQSRSGAALKKFWLLWLPADGEDSRVEAIIPVSEYDAQEIGKRADGTDARAVGTWHKAGERNLVVLTAITDGPA